VQTFTILGEEARVLSWVRTTLCCPTANELLPALSISDVCTNTCTHKTTVL